MDPYHTLGVPRDCTREEVKGAFRARSWQAHPDRGGEERAFIQLCTAYKAILKELDQVPNSVARKPARGWRNGPSSKRPGPNWEPELVVLDEPVCDARHTKPPDPNWDPELVVLGEPAHKARPAMSPDLRITRESYVSWLRKPSGQYARRESVWRSGWVRVIG